MSRAVSIGTMVKQIGSLQGTDDLNEWEQSFVTNIVASTNGGETTVHLTEKQIDRILDLWKKHYA